MREGAMVKTEPCPFVRTVVGSGFGVAPCAPPIKVILGRPSSVQAGADTFSIPIGLKLWPAVPVAGKATSFSWLAEHGDGPRGCVEVVVVDEVLVVDVVGATVVDVVVATVVVVVVAGVDELEQPARMPASPNATVKTPNVGKLRLIGLLAVRTVCARPPHDTSVLT